MGNVVSSLDRVNKKQKEAVEKLKEIRSGASAAVERVKTLQKEVDSQKKMIAVLKQAGREALTSGVCQDTQAQLQSAKTENARVVASLVALRERHATEVQALQAERDRLAQSLESPRTRQAVELLQLQRKLQASKDRETAALAEQARCDKSVQSLLRSREALLRKVDALVIAQERSKDGHARQLLRLSKVLETMRAMRPIAIDRINNSSKTITAYADSVKVSIANVSIQPPAYGVVSVVLRETSGRTQKQSLRFSGLTGLNILEGVRTTILAPNLQTGADVLRVLPAASPSGIGIECVRHGLLKNGWTFTFRPPVQGGTFTTVGLAVENRNESVGGMTKVQIYTPSAKKPAVML